MCVRKCVCTVTIFILFYKRLKSLILDLNGDGEIDYDEYLFAVKIRHGYGFDKEQSFLTWTTAEALTADEISQILNLFAKNRTYPLTGSIWRLDTAQGCREMRKAMTFKGKRVFSEGFIAASEAKASHVADPNNDASANKTDATKSRGE